MFLGRESLMTAAMLFSRNAYLPRFLDKVYLVIAGMFWLVSWVFLDGYYAEGGRRKILWPRFLRITAVELILMFFAQVLPAVYAKNGVNWPVLALITAGLAAGAAMLIYSRRLLARAPKTAAQSDWTTGMR